MNKSEINQYLTEQVFDECWHEFEENPTFRTIHWKCILCGKVDVSQNNFFTNEGCMTLWLKIQEMDWFALFEFKQTGQIMLASLRMNRYIHPDRLAPAVYKFLKERENEVL